MVMISRLSPEVIKICRPFIVEDEILKLCARKFVDFIDKSLTLEFAHRSALKCRPTHILDFPDGSERGSAIGLDISGKTFRLVHVRLHGDRICEVTSRLYEVPQSKLMGSGFKVVEYVARCVANFVETSDVDREERTILGVSIGFPIEQESLQEAKLLEWSDEFRCDDFVNEDFFVQLKLALKKYRSTKNLFLIAATNAAASSLVAGIYRYPTSRIGLVIGNETNLCYLEKLDNISLFPGDGIRARTAVGMDFKSFGDDGCFDFIKTEFDQQLDIASKNQGQYTLDKLISGQYFGEILRLCIVRMIQDGLILNGILKPKLKASGAIKSQDITDMETENENDFGRCKAILKRFGYVEPTDDDCCQIRFAARCVAKRSAHLLSAFLAAVVNHLDAKEMRICVDGPLPKQFPQYLKYIRKKLSQLKLSETKYIMTMNEKEDLGLGAALLAFIYKIPVIKVEEKYRVLPPMRPFSDFQPCSDCNDIAVDQSSSCSPSLINTYTYQKNSKKRSRYINNLE